MKQPVINIICPKIADNKTDSFWYYDKQIATVELNGKTVSIEARGSISVTFADNDAIAEATRRNYDDTHLSHLFDNGGDWLMNNWFAVTELTSDADVTHEEEIAYTYDEAILTAKEYLINL